MICLKLGVWGCNRSMLAPFFLPKMLHIYIKALFALLALVLQSDRNILTHPLLIGFRSSPLLLVASPTDSPPLAIPSVRFFYFYH